MVSTRLQSNSNSNCGDGAMLSASEIIASKLQCGIGCVTRSSASGNAQPIGHSKDINLRSTINLMDLPVELIQNILSHCGYKTVANLRVVSILFVVDIYRSPRIFWSHLYSSSFFIFPGEQENGRNLRLVIKFDVQQTTKFDVDTIPQHQSANASTRVREKAASSGLRIWYCGNNLHAT